MGLLLGWLDGAVRALGRLVGGAVLVAEGVAVGIRVGTAEGDSVRLKVGTSEGECSGALDRTTVGSTDGPVGEFVGDSVGDEAVGASMDG